MPDAARGSGRRDCFVTLGLGGLILYLMRHTLLSKGLGFGDLNRNLWIRSRGDLNGGLRV